MNKTGRSRDRKQAYECSDEEFVADLGLSLSSPEAAVALAVRSTVAEFAGLPNGSLYAHHTFADDLSGRGMFDSLDTVELLMTLEEKIGSRIPTSVAEKLPGLNELDVPHPLYTVADFVIPVPNYLVDAGIFAPSKPS